MSMQRKGLVAVLTIALVTLVCVGYCQHGRPIPAGQPKPEPKPAKVQDYESAYEARYERFHAMYLQNVEKVAKTQKDIRIRNYEHGLAEVRRTGSELARKESQVLETLRKQKAKGKLIDEFGFPSEELHAAINPTSDASAEIIHELLREKPIDDLMVTSSLYGSAEHLAKGWVTVLDEIIARQKEPSGALTWGIRTLYRAGIDRKRHRPTLERWAIGKQDNVALDILLFDTDKKTGEAIPVRSPANRKLVKTVSVNESLPEHRLLCAQYLAATGDRALAEKICLELVSVRLKAFDKPDDLTPDEEIPLARARYGARYLMFYELRTEKSFRHIYDLSMILEREEHEHDTMDPDPSWKSYGLSAAGRMEIEDARGFISEIATRKEDRNDD